MFTVASTVSQSSVIVSQSASVSPSSVSVSSVTTGNGTRTGGHGGSGSRVVLNPLALIVFIAVLLGLQM